MRIAGVVAEYNPFHRGHAYHLEEARRASGADYVVAVTSTCFTQRGEAALFSPVDRVRMALASGADAVFALPACWAVRDAECFALGGVSILDRLGCDAISFGTECTDVTLMRRVADMLEKPDNAFSAELTRSMEDGVSYPAALSRTAERFLPGAAALLDMPNSTLGVCYLRAMHRMNSAMDVVPIRRVGSYHASALEETMPSATALRGAILRGDWQKAFGAVPPQVLPLMQQAVLNGRIHRPHALDAALLYRLRTMTDEDYSALPDAAEGMEHRLRAAAEASFTRETLLLAAKTRRYSHARLSRMATHALLHMTHQELHALTVPPQAWLLGFRQEAAPLLKELKGRATLPIVSRATQLDRSESWVQTELMAHDLWALGAGLPAGLALTQGVIRT